jgi:hypothetical protein
MVFVWHTDYIMFQHVYQKSARQWHWPGEDPAFVDHQNTDVRVEFMVTSSRSSLR